MGAPSRVGAVVLALGLATAGFFAGAGGSAWRAREQRAEPWRKLHVEQEGTDGTRTHTRVVFENPKLALQAVDVTRSAEGRPELAHVVLRDGAELTVRYEDGRRPSALEGPDGSRAAVGYDGTKARVTLFAPGGTEVGSESVRVPVELRSALRLAEAAPSSTPALVRTASAMWGGLGDPFGGALLGALVGEALADEGEEDLPVTVRRDIELTLDVRTVGAKDVTPGPAQVDVSCAPFTCLASSAEVPSPGRTDVRVSVTATKKMSELGDPPRKSDLQEFKRVAEAERREARRVLPDIAGVIAVVGVVARACKAADVAHPICVKSLRNSEIAGAAVYGVSTHDVATEGHLVDARIEALYYEDEARRALDAGTTVEVCLARAGYARACTMVPGRPFADEPMPAAERALELKRGIGGTLLGSFTLLQGDGADCKFSPSPRTSGPLRLSFDNERNTVTAVLKADERGNRPNLSCNLGTANMTWAQTYTVTASQTFSAAALQSGGKLPLRLVGTMSGTGSFSFSNCRSSGGASANCPAGKSETYSYPVEVQGAIDLDTQTGSGAIVVRDAPLSTNGTWRVPAEVAP